MAKCGFSCCDGPIFPIKDAAALGFFGLVALMTQLGLSLSSASFLYIDLIALSPG